MASAPLTRHDRQLYRKAAENFNVNAKEGITYLFQMGLITQESPEEIAHVFHDIEVTISLPTSGLLTFVHAYILNDNYSYIFLKE